MPFEYDDLEPVEVALLALEYLRNVATWMEEATEEDLVDGEVTRTLASTARSTRTFHDELEARIHDRFGDSVPEGAGLAAHLHRRASLDRYDDADDEVDAADLLEVAIAEEEEAYQFFETESREVDDAWLQELFGEMARHTHGVILYLEAERETLADNEGTG